jgi:uncharacterized phage protein gp47/JayE
MDTVSLQISKDIVTPIVETKIKEAILEAMGGKEKVIQSVVNEVLTRKVSANGNVSQYSSDNKFTWIDVIVTQQIRTAVEAEVKSITAQASSTIKDELIKQLQSKKGASKVAEALLSSLNGSFASVYSSKFNISFKSKGDE